MKIEAVLFDLDNTLLMFKELTFFEAYSKKLYLAFRDIFSVEEFSKRLMFSTQQMIENNGLQTNAEYFIDSFVDGTTFDKQKLWGRLESFYANEFEQFQPLMTPHPDARDVILRLKEIGLKVVIATNPMFPMNIQQMRLHWANLGDINFDLITSADNFNYCKPRLEYYREICFQINLEPEKCLMVGNDALNDMIASQIGMKTYLTTEADDVSIELSRELMKNTNLELPKPNFTGSIRDLNKLIDGVN